MRRHEPNKPKVKMGEAKEDQRTKLNYQCKDEKYVVKFLRNYNNVNSRKKGRIPGSFTAYLNLKRTKKYIGRTRETPIKGGRRLLR